MGVGMGWFASERHTHRQVVYWLKELVNPERASPCRGQQGLGWESVRIEKLQEEADAGSHYSSIVRPPQATGELSVHGDRTCFPT